MGVKTDIEWCDSTVNSTSGCQGCELWIRGKVESCYAGQIHGRFSPSRAYPGPFEQVDLHPGRMAVAARWPDLTGRDRPDKPWLNGLPRTIFVGDMADMMSRAVPFDYIRDEVFAHIDSSLGRRHRWMILTKQPKRLAEFSRWYRNGADIWGEAKWPGNLMCGTSVTTQTTASRVGDLLGVPGPLFVSAEPLWESVDLSDYLGRGISLVIVGGESGRDARPCDLAWIRSIRDQCQAAGVSCFIKQLGSNHIDTQDVPEPGAGYEHPTNHWPKPVLVGPTYQAGQMIDPTRKWRWVTKDKKGGDWSEWPEDLRVREFPEV